MKRTKAISNLTFIALMAAFNVVFAALMIFLPALSIILYLLLPFVTTMVILVCQKKYYIIYFIASIFLCFIINMQGLEYIIFTLLPSLITGTILGICIEKKVNIGTAIIISSICQFVFSIVTIPLINLIYTNDNHSILEVFKTILGENKEYLLYKIFLPITYVTSLAQNIISFLLISSSITHFKVDIVSDDGNQLAYSSTCIGLTLLTIISIFVYDDVMYLLIAINISIFSLIISTLIANIKDKLVIIILVISLLTFLILFIALVNVNNLYVPMALLAPIMIISLFKLLTKNHQNVTIKK